MDLSILNPALLGAQAAQTFAASGGSEPYPHFVIPNACDPDRLMQAREEVINNLQATYKETDLFKMFQTGDLANMDALDEATSKRLPQLLALRDAIYSKQFRTFVQDLTGCGELSDRTDCACNVHAEGGHLLCHDDVIGNRCISFIIYLTDPTDPWTVEDGGALELYPESKEEKDAPHVVPMVTVLPTFNSIALFAVEPGRSFHAIQEVRTSGKPRMSIQGWYHARTPPEKASLATLKQLQLRAQDEQRGGFAMHNAGGPLSREDIDFLKDFVNPAYLQESAWGRVVPHFERDGSVQLQNFLKTDLAEKILSLAATADSEDGLGNGAFPSYEAGVGDGWKLVGPAHKQRYVRYIGEKKGRSSERPSTPAADVCGRVLNHVREILFTSPAFSRLLTSLTTLEYTGHRSEVRRFRPGLDYTVAHYGVLTKDPQLDAVLCFVNAPVEQDEETWWDGGEVGGFEAYLLADDESDAASEVYRRDDGEDSGVLNVSAAANSLNLVLRDEGLLKFVKFVGCKAVGSRWDISAVYLPEEDDDDEDDDDHGTM